MVVIVHVESLVKPNVNIKKETTVLRETLVKWLQDDTGQLVRFLKSALRTNGHYKLRELPGDLNEKLVNVNINIDNKTEELDYLMTAPVDECNQIKFNVECYFYTLFDEIMQNNFEEDQPATFHTLLPSKSLDGLWESLIFDSNIRLKLLNYVKTSLLFANQNVNPAIIAWNKVILLHGPPGTGKTSLCKALSQKYAIRLNDRYQNFQLIEINSHSLFSKWFSESGKLVLKLFDGIREFAEDNSNLIFVLIDEVESLAYDRQRNTGSDPSDAIRVVNALLTQIDSIRRYPNVIILASSNVTEAMDNAFVDRADIKQYIGLPSQCTTYKIFLTCIHELYISNIIHNNNEESRKQGSAEEQRQVEEAILSYDQLKAKTLKEIEEEGEAAKKAWNNANTLLQIVQKSCTLSGRTLRKLPFLAIALFAQSAIPMSIEDYLCCLESAVNKQLEDNEYFNV